MYLKVGALGLKNLDQFRDDFVFEFEYTHKNMLSYCENQPECNIIDYRGKSYTVTDKSRMLHYTYNIRIR